MAKETTEKETEQDPQDALSIGELRKLVTDMVSETLAKIKGVEKDQQGKAEERTEERLDEKSSIADEVLRQINRIKETEDKTREESELKRIISELQEKTKEKPPIERRRVHKLMGWGEPD